ncbi:PXDN [Mytilus coruscus]|uniref:PXDN n=1 Tax=Mytilus coruscus TaxID=42192 RepID=A0A6J8AEJ5_MYTCO|nr:PXDN [Mytilus coruscus]
MYAKFSSRREALNFMEAIGYAGDMVTTATAKYAERNEGAFPDRNEFSRQMAPYCPIRSPVCNRNDLYRTADGSCNNILNPLWGASLTTQARFLLPAYGDRFNLGLLPRIKSVTILPLQSPREISNALFNTGKSPPRSSKFTIASTHFGQFVDHDFISTPILKGKTECFSFRTAPGDFTTTCMAFVGSDVGVEPGCFPGDNRPAEVPMLTVNHIIFLSKHNNIVESLRSLGWTDGEQLYQEAKRSLQEYINISYILSTCHLFLEMKEYTNLDFGVLRLAAAYRFGHSLVGSFVESFNEDFTPLNKNPMEDHFFSTRSIRNFDERFGPDAISRWMTTQFKSRSDRFLTPSVRNRLFQTMPKNGFDLSALNIQRAQLQQIKKQTLSALYCRTMPVNTMPESAFESPLAGKKRIPCQLFPGLDFKPWDKAYTYYKETL